MGIGWVIEYSYLQTRDAMENEMEVCLTLWQIRRRQFAGTKIVLKWLRIVFVAKDCALGLL
jgi:hypothetical protein